jgi:hypothetical protein
MPQRLPGHRRRGTGHEARHVAHVGRAGWKDWNVVCYACDGDLSSSPITPAIRQLYAVQLLHAGLVILIPVVNRVVQRQLKAALDEFATIGEPVNHVLEAADALRFTSNRVLANPHSMFLDS